MKLTRFLSLPTFGAAVWLLSSCDSSEFLDPTDPIRFPDAVAESLQNQQSGDFIEFTAIDADEPLVDSLTFTNSIVASSFGTPGHVYRKTGRNEFELNANFGPEVNLQQALDTVLRSPAPNGTRLRELLLRADAVFTNAELQEIITLLNPVGAELSINPNNPLQVISARSRTYRHEITSSNRDLAAGSLAGNYALDQLSAIVIFRNATAAEQLRYRLITNQTKLPSITSGSITANNLETGRWILDLANN